MKLLLENWRRYLNEGLGPIESLLQKQFQTHPTGRKYVIEDDDSLEEDFTGELVKELTPSRIGEIIKEISAPDIARSLKKRYFYEEFPPDVVAVIDSIRLFTGDSVDVIRKPETFDPEKRPKVQGLPIGSALQRAEQGAGGELVKDDFVIANHVLTILSTMKNPFGATTIWRGMNLPEEVIKQIASGIGESFDPGDISSWTSNKSVAFGFAIKGLFHQKGPEAVAAYPDVAIKKGIGTIVFVVENCRFGAPISVHSIYSHEAEYLLGKKLVVTEVIAQPLADAKENLSGKKWKRGLPEEDLLYIVKVKVI